MRFWRRWLLGRILLVVLFVFGWGVQCALGEYDLSSEFSAGTFDDYVVFCCCHFDLFFRGYGLVFRVRTSPLRVRLVFAWCLLV